MRTLGLVALAAVGLGSAYLLRPLNVIERSQPKIVEISVPVDKHTGYTGSGAYVSSDGLILTCAHLFEHGGLGILVHSPSGSVSVAVLVRLDKKHDLAVIKTFPVHPVAYFKIGNEPKIGDAVTVFGSPLGFTGTVTKGYVSNVHLGSYNYTLHSAAINPGNSGGPLVDHHGKLIGVNVSSWMFNIIAPAESLENAVSLEYIRKLLED